MYKLNKSLVYSVNKNGPSTEPWGTPVVVGVYLNMFS